MNLYDVNFSQLKNQKMSKDEFFQQDFQETKKVEGITDTERNPVRLKHKDNIKKLVIIASVAGMGLLLNGCVAGYVEREPVYVVYARPQRPSEQHIWIDGNWRYKNQSHQYVQNTGYWERPKHGQSYVSGRWQTTPKGKSWSKGHWQKNRR
jgi:hypothetical protein